MRRTASWLMSSLATACFLAIGGCAYIPTSGPSTKAVNNAAKQAKDAGIQIIDVTDQVAQKLLLERPEQDFYKTLGDSTLFQQQLGVGDTVAISIWEAPPATLFGAVMGIAATGGSQVTQLPPQMIDANGKITVPFAGDVAVAGKTPNEVDRLIAQRLKGKAHEPQVMVQLANNSTSFVTVLGDVAASTRMQLTPHGERILDAIAAAGGVKQPLNKISLQVTRGSQVQQLPLEKVIEDPKQNVPLHANDVITALFQPYSFTTLGAVGQTQEVTFEVQGITLAQALSRAGGLSDARSDARGVYIFRFEDKSALNWPIQPIKTRADGKVPVIYRFNLHDPNTLFAAQSFMIKDKDMLYVSNAPVADMQKLVSIIFSMVYPAAEIGILAR